MHFLQGELEGAHVTLPLLVVDGEVLGEGILLVPPLHGGHMLEGAASTATTFTRASSVSTASTASTSGGCLKDKIYYDHGEVTAYGNNPTGGHCGFTELPSDEAKKHFVAISSQDAEGWKDGLYCGSCVRLKYTDGHVSQQISSFHDTSPRN